LGRKSPETPILLVIKAGMVVAIAKGRAFMGEPGYA